MIDYDSTPATQSRSTASTTSTWKDPAPRKKGYVEMHRTVFFHLGLSANARTLWGALKEWDDHWRWMAKTKKWKKIDLAGMKPSVAWLLKWTGFNDLKVLLRARQELIDANLLTVTVHKGRGHRTEYTLREVTEGRKVEKEKLANRPPIRPRKVANPHIGKVANPPHVLEEEPAKKPQPALVVEPTQASTSKTTAGASLGAVSSSTSTATAAAAPRTATTSPRQGFVFPPAGRSDIPHPFPKSWLTHPLTKDLSKADRLAICRVRDEVIGDAPEVLLSENPYPLHSQEFAAWDERHYKIRHMENLRRRGAGEPELADTTNADNLGTTTMWAAILKAPWEDLVKKNSQGVPFERNFINGHQENLKNKKGYTRSKDDAKKILEIYSQRIAPYLEQRNGGAS